MATYRCPECGASHKEQLANCRLCGAPLDIPVTVRTVTVDRSVAAERFRRRGMGHFVVIGLLIVLAIGLAAFFIGGVDASANRWFSKLPFVEDSVDDEWFAWADPDEVLIVDVPARMEEAEGGSVDLTSPGVAAWTTAIGNDTILVGYSEGLGFEVPATEDGDDRTRSSSEAALRAALEATATAQGGFVLRVSDPFQVGDGHYAIDGVIDGLSLDLGPGYGSMRLVLVDDEIVFVETLAYESVNDTHTRLRQSLVIVADDPSVTIPTTPENAPEPGGIIRVGDGE